MDHKIVTYRDKYEYNQKQDSCVRHSDSVYGMYCTSCELSVCFHCTEHDNHRQLYIQKAYKTKRQQYEGSIDNIRSEILYSRYFLLSEIKADVKKCHKSFSTYHSEMLRKAQIVKDCLDNISFGFHLKHKCLRYIKKINSCIARIQTCEYNIEHSSMVKFLLYVKKIQFSEDSVQSIYCIPWQPLHN